MSVPTEWDRWQPGRIAYRVYMRATTSYAVERRGPKGGIKTIAVYDNQLSAGFIRDALSQQKGKEL